MATSIVAAVKEAARWDSDYWWLYLEDGAFKSAQVRNSNTEKDQSKFVDEDLMRRATALPKLRRTLQKGYELYF